MTVATLFNTPSSEQEFMLFSFANQDHHDFIIGAMRNQGINKVTFQVDPIPQFDIHNWLQRHQQAHTDFTTALGIQGNDLSSLDIKNPQQVKAWIWLHANEHYAAMTKLGVESPMIGTINNGIGGAGGSNPGGGGALGIQSDSGGPIIGDSGGIILPG